MNILIVFEKCLAQADGPSRANFQQKIMCGDKMFLFVLLLATMKFLVHIAQLFVSDVRVDLRRGNI